MPNYAPPEDPPRRPHIEIVVAGTALYRIHGIKYGSTDFNPVVPRGRFDGGRFDSTRVVSPFLYASESVEAAVCEVLLRQVPANASLRRIPRAALRDKRLATLRTRRALSVVDLRGAGLSALGQDAWLTSCESAEYEMTRQWSDAILRWATEADGLIWRSRRNQELMSYIFYESRCGTDALSETDGVGLSDAAGLEQVRAVLQKHYFTL